MALYLRLLNFLKPYWGKLVFAMIFMALVAGANGLTAYVVKPVLDKIFFEKNASHALSYSLRRGPSLSRQGSLYLSSGLSDGIRRTKGHYGHQEPRVRPAPEAASFLLRQNAHGREHLEDYERCDPRADERFRGVYRGPPGCVQYFGLIFVVFYRDWKLATLAFVVLPFAVYPIVSFGKKLRKISTKTQRSIARLTSFLHETITGQRIVKAFSMEEYENKRFAVENEDLFRINMKRYKVRALSHPVMELLGGIAMAVIIFYGGKEVISGNSTPGNFFSFTAALLMLYEPIKRLNKENHNIQQGLAASQRVFEIVDREPEIIEKKDAIRMERVLGAIELKHVYFKYDEKLILKDVDLKIRRNEVLAVVGKSGVGKTTLANLIPRFYEVSQGSIEIDGVDIRDVTLNSLRGNIALVTQDVILFNDTIRNNIAYGGGHDEEKIVEAAKMAFAHDFILRQPKGYDTMVGEKGIRLSGGQKQRIAIARALFKDAPILILDEATSALDTASEQEVQKGPGEPDEGENDDHYRPQALDSDERRQNYRP